MLFLNICDLRVEELNTTNSFKSIQIDRLPSNNYSPFYSTE